MTWTVASLRLAAAKERPPLLLAAGRNGNIGFGSGYGRCLVYGTPAIGTELIFGAKLVPTITTVPSRSLSQAYSFLLCGNLWRDRKRSNPILNLSRRSMNDHNAWRIHFRANIRKE